jgi:hypothetical protein
VNLPTAFLRLVLTLLLCGGAIAEPLNEPLKPLPELPRQDVDGNCSMTPGYR